MIKKFFLIAIFQASINILCYSQETALFNTYIFDPYVYNPAYITSSGYSEVNIFHRRQWVGINNAPVITSVNGQIQLGPRISLGANIINDESVLLNSTSAAVTFGYKVPLGTNNHFVSFGLSGGVFFNQLDFEGIADLNDPALLNAQDNNIDLTGQFGISYTLKNFTIGFSLPQLFQTNAFQSSDLEEVGLGKLNNQIITASYKKELSAFVNGEIYGNYRLSEDDLNYFEAGALAGYKDFIKVGGFYRQESGPGFLLQIVPNEKFLIAYGHEFATNQDLSFGGSTHEFQLKIRLGKKAKQLVTKEKPVIIPVETAPLPSSVAVVEEPVAEEEIIENEIKETPKVEIEKEPISTNSEKEKVETKVVVEESVVETVSEKTIAEEVLPEQKSSDQHVEDEAIEMNTGYYLVVGSFASETNARNFFKEVRKDFPSSEFGYNPVTQYYFIYLYIVGDAKSSQLNTLRIRKETPFKDAWLMKIH